MCICHDQDADEEPLVCMVQSRCQWEGALVFVCHSKDATEDPLVCFFAIKVPMVGLLYPFLLIKMQDASGSDSCLHLS